MATILVRGRQQLLEFVEQEVAVLVDGRPFQHRAVPLAVEMPGHDVGVVLHDGEHDLVAFADHHAAEALGHEVDGLGRVAGEDDLVLGRRIEEAPHAFARILEGLGGGVREEVQAAMHVGIFFRVALHHRVEHRLRLLGRGGIVEIDQRLAIDLARRGWGSRARMAATSKAMSAGPPLWSVSQRVGKVGRAPRACRHGRSMSKASPTKAAISSALASPPECRATSDRRDDRGSRSPEVAPWPQTTSSA